MKKVEIFEGERATNYDILKKREDFVLSSFNWSTGLMLMTRVK